MYCCGLICKFYIQPRKSNTMSQKRVPTDSTIKSGWSQTTLLITSKRISSSTYLNILNLPGEGGGHSLIRPIRVCAAEQGMVFKVLSLKQGIQFHYYCVRGTRMQPLICVGCSVHYWVSCAINKVFLRLHFRRRRHTFASLWGACLRFASLWRANSCGDSCVLGVHLSKVCWGLIFCQSFAKWSSFKKFAESS